MSKKLNITAITNDLEGSAFFPGKKPTPLSPAPQSIPDVTPLPDIKPTITKTSPIEPKLQTPERTNAPTAQRHNGKRIITRNSFEIYEDQMDSLRKISFHEKMDGKLGSMSAMVREAIDKYLLNKTL